MTACVEARGYQMVATPVLEHTELFVRKSGGERLAQTYEFQFRGRELALRPEHTASVIRMYVDHLQSEPLPQRLAYCGPVFRYESPQAGRSRQFTEFGCELIGAEGTLADFEAVQLAVEALASAGVMRQRLVLGHIGIVIGLLQDLNLDQRAQDWLLWSMERLRRGESTARQIPEHLLGPSSQNGSNSELDTAIQSMDRDAVVRLLRDSGVHFDSGVRSAEEIVQGLFDKQQRTHDPAVLLDALSFVSELIDLAGPPDDALGPIRALVAARGLDVAPIDEVQEIVDLLRTIDEVELDVIIDLGMGRGLRYYTGMLFEIYARNGSGLQLAGGGRYDDLAQALGARLRVPANGFSIGVERAALAADQPANERSTAQPSVVVLAEDSTEDAVKLARMFRDAGWTVLFEVRRRSRSAARRWAERQGARFVAWQAVDDIEAIDLETGDSMTFTVPPGVEDFDD